MVRLKTLNASRVPARDAGGRLPDYVRVIAAVSGAAHPPSPHLPPNSLISAMYRSLGHIPLSRQNTTLSAISQRVRQPARRPAGLSLCLGRSQLPGNGQPDTFNGNGQPDTSAFTVLIHSLPRRVNTSEERGSAGPARRAAASLASGRATRCADGALGQQAIGLPQLRENGGEQGDAAAARKAVEARRAAARCLGSSPAVVEASRAEP